MKKSLLLVVVLFITTIVFGQTVPEILYYKFDGTGTSVPNLASSPPAGTATATIVGGLTQSGTNNGLCGGALVGVGGSSSTNYVNTGWNTALGTGAWTIMFWTNNIPNNTTLHYQFGDASASSFRCFNNGVAGAGNWMLRGPVTDVLCTGCAPVGAVPSVTAFVYDPVAGNIKAYHNGVLNNTVAQGALNINGANFTVGAQGGSTGMGAGQLMDEFRFYNRALPPAEILAVTGGCYPFISVPNDAGVASVDSPDVFCAGPQDVWATVQNFGNNQIDTVTVNWSYNGVIQTPVNVYQLIDTANGTNPDKIQVLLGSKTITTVDTIIAWTSMPNNQIDTVTSNDTSSVKIVGPSMSGTFTIGGVSPNYPNFTSAVADLNTFGVCGPVVFNVRTGNYNEQISLGTINGTSSTNTITFNGSGRDSVILNFSSTLSTANYTIDLNGASFVTFQNIGIYAYGQTYGRVINYSATSDNITFDNNYIVGDTTPTTTSTNMTLVYCSNGNNSNNSVFTDNIFKGGSYAMYMYGSSTTSLAQGLVVDNNSFSGHYYYGIRAYYQDAPQINNNMIDLSLSPYTGTMYGIYEQYCDNASEVTGNIINMLRSQSSYGIYLGNNDGTSTNKGLVSNNMVALGDTNNTSSTNYGMYVTNSGNQDIYNNSINDLGNGTNTRGVYITGGGLINFVNNNISGFNGYNIYLTSSFSLTASDNNNFYNKNGNVGYDGSIAQATLAAWQSATGGDGNSVSADPQFYAQNDLHTCAQALDGAGMSLSSITTDIDGDIRNASTPDIGADEFAALVGSFLGPDTSICANDSIMIGVSVPGTYLWTPTGDTTGTVWVSPGSYSVIASTVCGSGNDAIVIGTLPSATASFTSSISFLTHTFTNTSTNATSYYWDFGDGNNSTLTNPVHVYAMADTFTVTLIAFGDCGNDTTTQQVTPNTVGLDEYNFTNGLVVSPNPNNGQFAVSITLADNESVKMEVIDITGRVVYTENVSGKEGQNTVNVNLANAKGVYFIKLTSKLGTAVERVVIK